MSTQFVPRSINVDADLLPYVRESLDNAKIIYTARPYGEDITTITVAPAHADVLAEAYEGARASKEREVEEKRKELEASIDVGGLSLDEARRLVGTLQGARASTFGLRDLPTDLQRSLGVAAPEHEAVIRVRFRRDMRPGRVEVQTWVNDALRTYFDEHEQYCGISPQADDSYDAIVSVAVESVEAAQDS